MHKNRVVLKKCSRSANLKYNNYFSFHPQTIIDQVLPNWLTKIEKFRKSHTIILFPNSGRFSMDSPIYNLILQIALYLLSAHDKTDCFSQFTNFFTGPVLQNILRVNLARRRNFPQDSLIFIFYF
jgi:hypothetical protein